MAGYWGGKVNDFLEWFYNIFTSIPYILLILAFAAVFKRALDTIIVIPGAHRAVTGLPGWCAPNTSSTAGAST